ncbi:MAG: hypothetical protein E7559_00235 [Ruminococcaceae bacterium]|nr:hypothetical protein [Oscillospiraceae bacterium]
MSKTLPLDTFRFGNIAFWAGFTASAFPTALDEETDMTAAEILSETDLADMGWWDEFTGYYDGVMDDADGYVDDPNCFECALTDTQTLKIEFHPGDIVYFAGGNQIGCTGGEYDIQKFPYSQLRDYSSAQQDELLYLLLLPLAVIEESEAEDAKAVTTAILRKIFEAPLAERLAGCIVFGLTEE